MFIASIAFGLWGAWRVFMPGSGDVRANEVKGQISKTIMGSGSVRVGG